MKFHTCGSLRGALIRTTHLPIRPVHRIHPTEFLTVRLHPVTKVKAKILIMIIIIV